LGSYLFPIQWTFNPWILQKKLQLHNDFLKLKPNSPNIHNKKPPSPSHMSMIYNHFTFDLSSQNLMLVNNTRPWGGWYLSMLFQFYTPSMNIKKIFWLFFSKNWTTHQFHTRHSTISNQLCNKTIKVASLKAITNGMFICKLIYPHRSNEQNQATNVEKRFGFLLMWKWKGWHLVGWQTLNGWNDHNGSVDTTNNNIGGKGVM
jgi:hypothetical protein